MLVTVPQQRTVSYILITNNL